LHIVEQANNIRKKNIWIGTIGGIGLLLSLMLFSIYKANKQKQLLQSKKIQILQQEQKINQFKAIMDGEEKERSRVARELHDGLGGMLAAVKMNFSALQNQYEKDVSAVSMKDFDELSLILDEVSSEIRKTAHNMMPDILLRHGIEDALKLYVDTANGDPLLYINLQINGPFNDLEDFIQLSLYRIIQELVQNIIKHAKASNALVQLNRKASTLTILVKDNGKGFDTSNAKAGLGLQNVRFRVHSLNGNINTVSSEAKGTSVIIELPIAHKTEYL
jgi:signal transduction histidine kinase